MSIVNTTKEGYRHITSGGPVGVDGSVEPADERTFVRSSAMTSIFRTLSSRTGFVKTRSTPASKYSS